MAEKIESYRFSKRFKKEYNSLPKEIQKAFDKKLSFINFGRELPFPAKNLSTVAHNPQQHQEQVDEIEIEREGA